MLGFLCSNSAAERAEHLRLTIIGFLSLLDDLQNWLYLNLDPFPSSSDQFRGKGAKRAMLPRQHLTLKTLKLFQSKAVKSLVAVTETNETNLKLQAREFFARLKFQ
jgi:hypothetical protein